MLYMAKPQDPNNLPPDLAKHRLLKKREVAALLGVGENTVGRLKDAGKLPAVHPSPGRTAWKLATVLAYIDSL